MPKTFVLHDESVNTYGFRMLTSGANLEEFRKNPVMLLNHNDYSLPIGRWENIRIEEGKILADAVFDLSDPTGRTVAEKVEKGFLRMASIGAWAPEEVSDDAMLKLDGQTGVTVLRWTVREASIVTIGANHNALALYDRDGGERINLDDRATLIRLMDNLPTNNNNTMKTINELLCLKDGATPAEQSAALSSLIAEKQRLEGEVQTLTDAVDKFNKEQKEKLKAEAITLVDAAVADGRIDAKGKETYLQLFDKDHEAAKIALSSIMPRQSVVQQIERSSTQGVALKDFEGKSWDELDRSGKLLALKDNFPELYAEKFKERFGVEYKGK